MLHFLQHLAQISADAVSPLVQWIIGASGAMFLLNQALGFYKSHLREQPAPRDTYATKDELRQAHGRMTREGEALAEVIAELKAEDRRLNERLETEIKDIRDEVIAIPEKTIDLLIKTKNFAAK